MTLIENQGTTRTGTTPNGQIVTEFSETLKLAVPIALTQLGQVAMMTTDLALIGRLGDDAVAAAALAQTIFFTSFVIGMGLVSAVAPLTAQAFGARDPRLVRRSLRVGLWAGLLLAVPLTLIQLFGESALTMLGQAPSTAHSAQRYLDGLAWGIAPAMWFIAIRSFMGSVNRPEPALWITLAAIPANALLAYALINGAFGLPRLDLLGAGLATTLVNAGMCVAILWIAHARRPFRKYHVLGRFWRIDWKLMGSLLAVGAPMSGSYLLEYGLFAAAALLMGLIGTAALTAHQIALNTAAVLFMVPFGIGMAATVRVGHAVGRGDPFATRRAGFVAVALGIIFMATMTLAVVAARHEIARFFLGNATQTADADMAATLLLVGATFFIADGIQTVASGALRGLNDTRIPLAFAAISYWLVGFPMCWVLAFQMDLGAVGVWIGLSIGIAVYAVLLTLRFRRLTEQHYLPPDIAAGSIP